MSDKKRQARPLFLSLITHHSSLPLHLYPVELRSAAGGRERDARALDVSGVYGAAHVPPFAAVRAEGEAVALAALGRHAQVERVGLGRGRFGHDAQVAP